MPRLSSPGRWLRWTLLLAALALATAWSAGVAAQPSPRTLTLDEYQAELTRALAQLEQTPPDAAPATVEAIARDLHTIQAVTLPSGATVMLVPLWPHPDDADASLPAPELAQAQLHALLAQWAAAPNDNSAARLAALEELFLRPEFNTPANWFDRLWSWLEQLWERFWERFFPQQANPIDPDTLSTAQRLLLWGVVGIGVAGIIWLLAAWLRRLIGIFVQQAEAAAPDDLTDGPRTAAEARAQAQAAAQSGQYRVAVRRLYLAALLQLAEGGWIEVARNLTNREVLGRVPADSPVYAHLLPVVETFDRVWYGIHEPDHATFLAYTAEIDALAAVARQSPPTEVQP
jgi:hypothetical protein